MFTVYLELGFSHLTDISAYDHFLFLLSLCVAYTFRQWRQVFWLATAFTIGHSVTLALAALSIIAPAQTWIEFLVAVSIMLGAILNWWHKETDKQAKSNMLWLYGLALFFGLIHGMAFSNFLRASLMPGEESQLILQLVAFNIGVEIGQIAILVLILLLNEVVLSLLKLKQREWILFISGVAFGLGLLMALERVQLL